MAKKLTLTETWRLCLSMWRWIAKQVKAGSKLSVNQLKEQWVEKHWPGKDIQDNCFFCEYSIADGCPTCPGVLVDERFDCDNEDCHWFHNPIKFNNKLVSLNKKRKSHSKPAHRKAAE